MNQLLLFPEQFCGKIFQTDDTREVSVIIRNDQLTDLFDEEEFRQLNGGNALAYSHEILPHDIGDSGIRSGFQHIRERLELIDRGKILEPEQMFGKREFQEIAQGNDPAQIILIIQHGDFRFAGRREKFDGIAHRIGFAQAPIRIVRDVKALMM